jgi:hypothetical protein
MSIQPCDMNSFGAPSRPQWRTWVDRPRMVRNSEREGFMVFEKKYGRSDYTHAVEFLPVIPICR